MNALQKFLTVTLFLCLFTVHSGWCQLAVSSNGRHLAHPDGTPFFWLGDTGWGLLQKLDREAVKYYLKTRARQGFSVIHAAAVHKNPFITPELSNIYNDRPFIDDDPTRPNLTPGNDPDDATAYDYWDHIEYIINTAEQYGIYILFLPVFNMAEGDGYNLMDRENAYVYGKFIGERFGGKNNIIWCIGGDVLADNEERKAIWDLMAKGVTEGAVGSEDYSRTLMTFHTRGGHSSSDYFPDAEWLDFHLLQTWDSFTRIYGAVSADYQRKPVKPILHGEGAYEEGPEYPTKPITPLIIRKQAYWAIFAGGLHTYGNTHIWNFGTNPKYASKNWQEEVQSEGAKQLSTARKILEKIKWWDFEPAPELIREGAGEGAKLNVAMRSYGGDRILLYNTSNTPVTLDLSGLPGGKPTKGYWINPINGKKLKIKKGILKETNSFTPPLDWEDAILFLQ